MIPLCCFMAHKKKPPPNTALLKITINLLKFHNVVLNAQTTMSTTYGTSRFNTNVNRFFKLNTVLQIKS